MGVYIKGIEMPSNCNDCPLNYDSIDCMVADNALRKNGGGDFLFDHERHPNCPLVPVPPHGRCVDADALDYTMFYKENWIRGTSVEALAVWKSDIDVAPTVIPAEEGE